MQSLSQRSQILKGEMSTDSALQNMFWRLVWDKLHKVDKLLLSNKI